MKTIARNGITYAVIGSINEATEGWTFCSEQESPLQYGFGLFQFGDKLSPHFHKVRERIKQHKTQEFIYVARGSVMVDFYNDEEQISSHLLSMGSFVFLIDGAHGFRVVSNDTCLIEIKNGPFVSTELDKVRI